MTEPTRSRDDALADDDAVDSLLSGAGSLDDPLATAILHLRQAATRPAPEPSPALAGLFASGSATDELGARRTRRRHRAIVLGIAVAGATSALTLSGVAAAHDALPGPAQGVISGIINDLTPFHIAEVRPPRVQHGPVGTDLPSGTQTPTVTVGLQHGVPTGSRRSGGGGDERSGGGTGSGSDSGTGDFGGEDGSGGGTVRRSVSSGDGSGSDDGSGSSGGSTDGGGDSAPISSPTAGPSPSPSDGGSSAGGSDGGGSDGGSDGSTDGGTSGG